MTRTPTTRSRALSSGKTDADTIQFLREEVLPKFQGWLDEERLLALAYDRGCVERFRVHHAGKLAIALILSCLQHGADTQGRWLDAQALYERLGGNPAGTTSFRVKLRALEPVLCELMRRRAEHLGRAHPPLQGRLRDFADVLIPDGCAFKIAAALAGVWPGTGTPAEFKLHAVYSVRAGTAVDLHASAGSVHDTLGFTPDGWVRDALYVWDLGYQDYDRFVDAVVCGAVPLQRLKDKLNPVVEAWYDAAGRHAVSGPQGRLLRLNEVCERGLVPLTGTLDLDVAIRDTQGRQVTARAVCVPYRGEDRWYLTTLPRDVFPPFDVAELYRLRWEVELFFRTIRGAVRLDEVRRMRNPASLRVALLASLLAATLGQELTVALNTFEATWCWGDAEPPEPAVHPAEARAVVVPPVSVVPSFPPRSPARTAPAVRIARTG